MEIKRKVNAPAAFIFDKIIDSALFDIRKQTQKSLTRKQLQGFEYVKIFDSKRRAKIKIVEVKTNEIYSIETSTTKNTFKTTYTIQPIDELNCEITCTETMESHGFIQKANDMVLGTLVGWLKKRQIKVMLDAMATAYSK
ncbi:MAG: DUF3284 domain-containing protein [Lactobacillales bacterium]|jgi:hypothetical protein|nr:DUF3284 domain-containing protein [Lactobacillales bacterium]